MREGLHGVVAELEEAERCGLLGGPVHTLQLMFEVFLENQPVGFSKGWKKAQSNHLITDVHSERIKV